MRTYTLHNRKGVLALTIPVEVRKKVNGKWALTPVLKFNNKGYVSNVPATICFWAKEQRNSIDILDDDFEIVPLTDELELMKLYDLRKLSKLYGVGGMGHSKKQIAHQIREKIDAGVKPMTIEEWTERRKKRNTEKILRMKAQKEREKNGLHADGHQN